MLKRHEMQVRRVVAEAAVTTVSLTRRFVRPTPVRP